MDSKEKMKIISLSVIEAITSSDQDDITNSVMGVLEISKCGIYLIENEMNGCSKLSRQRNSAKQQEERQKLYTNIIHIFPDVTFSEHFRMSRGSFDKLLQELSSKDVMISQFFIPHTVQLMITLWILATPDSFRSVGSRFKIDKGTAHYVYRNVITKILSLGSQFIKWPCQVKRKVIKRLIEEKSGFPNVVGFIDATFIPIRAPVDPRKYFNRKKFPALILQAVCDQELSFTDIYFGEVGSVNDKRVFANSPLGKKIITNPEMCFSNEEHLLGDGGYTLSDKLLIPYIDNGHLLDEQIHFNNVLSGIRSTIERAFSLLKGKWRRLKYLDCENMNYLVNHTIACCILHNFLILQKDVHLNDHLNRDEDADTHLNEAMEQIEEQITRHEKRDIIAAYLYDLHCCN